EKPCHNDTLPENWIVGDDKLYLIDWEYAGMNDPNFDLAALSLENSLSEEEERIFLSEYYGGEISEENYGRVVINKYLCDYLWALWSVLQIDNGKPYDEYWPYGLNRFNRSLAQIEDGSLDKAIKAITK
ncbi:MAG: phosphotransferase, partial [Dehalobacterium sp.]